MSEHDSRCIVCGSKGEYTCPRCGFKYCSHQCYKKHSVTCIKSFASQTLAELNTKKKVSAETVIQMQKTLGDER